MDLKTIYNLHLISIYRFYEDQKLKQLQLISQVNLQLKSDNDLHPVSTYNSCLGKLLLLSRLISEHEVW